MALGQSGVFGLGSARPPWDDTNAIREMLFSVERLEEHARSLAAAQEVKPQRPRGHPLLDRLIDNEASLIAAYRSICEAVSEGAAITPAAEWLIDNFHQVERQIRQVRSDLPPRYYRQLPKLAAGPFAGYPRVFGMAWAFVAHTDSRFDVDAWCGFVGAYQTVQPLTVGELWASAITLRIILIENLRRIAARIVYSREERRRADLLANRLLGVDGQPDESMKVVMADLDRGSLSDAFLLQLVYRLRDQGPSVAPLLTRLDDRLAAEGKTVDDAVNDEQQKQVSANVTVRNIITSMRRMSDVDWTEIFEKVSLFDAMLAVGCGFAEMDFATRNLYRTAIEELARGSGLDELDVARRAVLAGATAKSESPMSDERRTDPGYYLCAGGRPEFEAQIGFRPRLQARFGRFYRTLGIGGYIGAAVIVAMLLLALPIVFHAQAQLSWIWLGLLGTLGAIPALDAAVALVNQGVTHRFGATQLPSLDLRDGVPKHLRTLVVVPTLLTTREAIVAQIELLEVHRFASVDGDVQYALLSDWIDAASETAEGDHELLQVAIEEVARLNRRHGPAPGGDRFLLLHRRRLWNEGQRKWIGWERKRGKLRELNRLLRGASDTTFLSVDGHPPQIPEAVRYVITLDADTRLRRDTVRRLIGKMAHPLNQPRHAASGRVVEGHAVLQPRVTSALPAAGDGSVYRRLFSNMSGIDQYSSAVSDVYQDLFEEGSYAGKGIYAVDAFEVALSGRAPESTLLSHDLFEGVFARAALVSDIEVVEAYPTRYDVAALRYHRWARGDWQLLPWILGWTALLGVAPKRPARMPASGRWKMVDNLRRTLSPMTCLLALFAGWLLPFDAALVWTIFVLGTIVLPSFVPALTGIVPRHAGLNLRSHFRAVGADFRLALLQSLLIVTFLAHQAWLMGDAIVRTLFRLLVTRRNLLEWTPAAQATIGREPTMFAYYRWMSGAVLTGVAVLIAALLSGNQTWLLAAPFAILWISSPAIARWVSLPSVEGAERTPTEADARALRLVARRTWRFFETFVVAADHMLPPDNFQEDPASVVAHRTSPTNVGLYLLSTASAHDFGWLGTVDTIERLEATLSTMGRLLRFRGHFYNWYDTSDLRPLDPQYVSSVDSGNLAGHLIALANACEEWGDLAAAVRLKGISDTLEILVEEINALRDTRRTETVTWRQLDDALALLVTDLHRPLVAPEKVADRLSVLATSAETLVDITQAFALERGDGANSDMLFWAQAARNAIASHERDVDGLASPTPQLSARLSAIGRTARETAMAMEFDFLLDRERMLLSIGYLVPEGVADESCYDLLASEARLASYVGIAKGDIPTRHWSRLGHEVTPVGDSAALISWSGSMFEYLMPSIVMRTPVGSVLEHTNKVIVRRQIEYGKALGIPWGVSESAYNARDLELTYQYSNFGVPELGLKRGLGESAVVAPYATALAATVDPIAAAGNFERLVAEGGRGHHGFFEALDYTPARLPDGKTVAVIRAYMAHHQGMTIVAIADALLEGAMRRRFHAEPMMRAAELLLQERMPREIAAHQSWASDITAVARVREIDPPGVSRPVDPHAATPATHLLSNGRYSVMLTAAGSGYSRLGALAVTRWREDPTCDDWGSYIYFRDVESGRIWSAGVAPTGVEPDRCSVTFNADRASFSRRDGELNTTLDVVVSAEDDAEVRRVTITNSGRRARDIEVTSYAEVVIAPQTADIAHPAFSKLFVQTEYDAGQGAILATRRRRSSDEPEVWAAHHSVVEGEGVGQPEFETDRSRFLGRGRGVRNPAAVIDGRLLSGSTGSVLDPVFALRRRVRLAPGATVRIGFWTMVAASRIEIMDLIDKTNDLSAFDRAATLAWTKAQVQFHHLRIDRAEADLFQRLAGHLLFAAPALRSSSETILRGAGAQPGLWAQSISGDLPIILLRITNAEDISIVHQLLQAMEYWRHQQLAVDLVIVNERSSSYVQDLQNAIEALVRTSQAGPMVQASQDSAAGRVFVLRADLIPPETRTLLRSIARIVLVAERGGLAEQLNHISEVGDKGLPTRASRARRPLQPTAAPKQQLEYFNGLGGFADDGKEYVTILGPGQSTPAPWINVVANPAFGFQVSAEGSGFSWSVNSREHQLTPWSNDPVADPPGEALYLCDEDTDELWSPTASPIRHDTSVYVARHGWGYSRFEHEAHGIASDLLVYVPLADPIKITRLKLHNTTNRRRRLSVTAYVEWVLGGSRGPSAPFVSTEVDRESGAIFARNQWNAAFGSRVAFLDLGGRQMRWTADRREFIGRNGSLADPAGLAAGVRLSGAVGGGLDPCGVVQTIVELAPGDDIEIVLFLGDAAGPVEASELIARYRQADLDAVLNDVREHWQGILGAVQVKTPDRSMDIMLNGWLLYQTLACRIWARSGFYQASGAYGFRDQLQDGMALAAIRPSLTREHLVRAASRQFEEGDVQHWWLPHSGQGVRTRISDDKAWLAYAAAQYIEVSGDDAVLDELIPFLEGPKLANEDSDSFFTTATSDRAASLYEHCALALDASLAVGSHGMPLIGGGDWNDGMNRVGEGGKGESVWLAWLLHTTLTAFARLADTRLDAIHADAWREHASTLAESLEQQAWDGDWYRRAWFDDGAVMGSATNDECRIDSIAQSWAVISGAGQPQRAAQAMAAVERELIDEDNGLALLFTPPFNLTTHDPGYIKGYPPGIRENGGQYTHGAIWAVIAFALLGEGDKAARLFAQLNPINHARTRAELRRYKVEPYVIAADIYAAPAHLGRGGWTWYTGSAGWMQRAGLESILGLRFEGPSLHLDPCIPNSWPGFEVTLRRGSARLRIKVENPNGVSRGLGSARLDGTLLAQRPLRLDLIDDDRAHELVVTLG